MMVQQLVVMLAMGLASATSGLQPQQVTVHKLKFVAAEDVAKAVTKYAEFKNLSVELSTDLRTNSVIVTGDLAQQKQVVGVIAAIDKEPPMILAEMTILDAPATFADDVGLGAGEKWVLTLREAKMLSATIRSREGKDVQIQSKPQLLLTDNQQGYLQMFHNNQEQEFRVTPRISPTNGTITIRMETKFIYPRQPKGADIMMVVASESVKDAHTLVIRGPRTKKVNEDTRDILIIMTVHNVVRAER